MFAGFNLELEDWTSYVDLEKGREIEKTHCGAVKTVLKNFINSDGSINATALQNDWFPEIKADIFISHSSKDKELALTLAGWLKINFDLDSFIDSCVWGYCDDLLNQVDNHYCYQEESHTYNYIKRNYSTSHIHNMLSAALNTMIDKCECIFFLNTGNSIEKKDIFSKTESPWIYNELSTIKTIRKKIPDYFESMMKRNIEIYHEGTKRIYAGEEFPKFIYNVDIKELYKLSYNDLIKWGNNYKGQQYPLGGLYKSNIKEMASLIL